MANANFLESKRLRSAQNERRDKKTFLAFFIVAVTVLVVFAVILGINIYFYNQNNQVTSNINRIRAQIMQNEDNERDYLVFYNKIGALTEILERRGRATELIVWTTEYFEYGGVYVRTVEYDIFSSEFQLLLQAYSVFYLQNMVDLLAYEELHENFERIENIEMMRDPNGHYNLLVSFVVRR